MLGLAPHTVLAALAWRSMEAPCSSGADFAAAMASPAKKRHLNEQKTVDTFERILEAMGNSDMRYILKELQEGPPALVPCLASLIRDKVLRRAIEKNQRSAAPARLGKKLPEKVMRFRALPITVKQEFIDMCTAEKLVWEETETSPAITLTSDQLNELMECQLRQSSWSCSPKTPRLAVFWAIVGGHAPSRERKGQQAEDPGER